MRNHLSLVWRFLPLLCLGFLLLSSCSTASPSTPSATAALLTEECGFCSLPTTTGNPLATATSAASSTSQPVSLPTSTPSPSATPSPTFTAAPTETILPSLTPTYAILRGSVLEQANCRYGPGAAYLYKYGLYPGYNLEVIGRNDTGSWVVVQAIGGDNPCWVKASLMEIRGEVLGVAPMQLPLPQSPYYGPLTGVWADRAGSSVILTWDALVLRAGDDSEQFPYLVEAWLCQSGHLVFSAIGSWEPIVTVKDEPGCSEPSHARVYGVEKHGYTAWVTVPWPNP